MLTYTNTVQGKLRSPSKIFTYCYVRYMVGGIFDTVYDPHGLVYVSNKVKNMNLTLSLPWTHRACPNTDLHSKRNISETVRAKIVFTRTVLDKLLNGM